MYISVMFLCLIVNFMTLKLYQELYKRTCMLIGKDLFSINEQIFSLGVFVTNFNIKNSISYP